MIKQYFTLKDFEHITGIDSNTLRVWKSRYGILKPAKVISGALRFTQEDLRYLMHAKVLLDSGMRISEIVAMDKNEMVNHVRSKTLSHIISLPDSMESELTMAVMEMDEKKLNGCYKKLLEFYPSFQEAMLVALLPFLKKVGQLWENESIHAVQEHFFSNFIRNKIISATDFLPEIDQPPEYLLFLPESEYHEIPLLFTNFMLLKSGRKTLYLGSSVPYTELDMVLNKMPVRHVVSGWTFAGEKKLHFEKMTNLVQQHPANRFLLAVPGQHRKLLKNILMEQPVTNVNLFENVQELSIILDEDSMNSHQVSNT